MERDRENHVACKTVPIAQLYFQCTGIEVRGYDLLCFRSKFFEENLPGLATTKLVTQGSLCRGTQSVWHHYCSHEGSGPWRYQGRCP